jgi:hypothetical protein
VRLEAARSVVPIRRSQTTQGSERTHGSVSRSESFSEWQEWLDGGLAREVEAEKHRYAHPPRGDDADDGDEEHDGQDRPHASR